MCRPRRLTLQRASRRRRAALYLVFRMSHFITKMPASPAESSGSSQRPLMMRVTEWPQRSFCRAKTEGRGMSLRRPFDLLGTHRFRRGERYGTALQMQLCTRPLFTERESPFYVDEDPPSRLALLRKPSQPLRMFAALCPSRCAHLRDSGK